MRNLRLYRQRAGMSRSMLAKLVHTTTSSICRYENGKREPNAKTAIMIAKALNTSVENLVGDTDDTTSTDVA